MTCDNCKRVFTKTERIYRIENLIQSIHKGLYAYPIAKNMLYICKDCKKEMKT